MAPEFTANGDTQPLSWSGIKMTKVSKDGTFNLNFWTSGDKNYELNVQDGSLSVEGNNDVC